MTTSPNKPLLKGEGICRRFGEKVVLDEVNLSVNRGKVVSLLGERERPMVFLLWGAHARSKKRLIKNPAHRIIESPHPSPLSAYRGFFGSKCFSRTNAYLEAMGEVPVDWR